MTAFNDLLRFGLEMAGVAALAVWGWTAGSSGPVRFVLAIGAPLALVIVWGLLVAPNADSPLGPSVRIVVGSMLLLGAATALWLSGHERAAITFAVLNVVNTALMFVLPA